MKRVALMSVALAAVMASSAMAASIVEVGTSMNAVSGDGAWAGGRVAHASYEEVPATYEVATGTTNVLANKGAGEVTGIGSGVGPISANAGSAVYNYASFIGRYGDNATSIGTAQPTSECLIRDAVEKDGGGYWLSGKDTKSDAGIRWDSSGSAYTRINGVNGATTWNGVATNGNMIGTDRSGRNNASDGVCYYNGSTAVSVPSFSSDTRGQGNGLSDNDAFGTGYFYTDDALSLAAFRWDKASNTTVELYPVNYGVDGTQSNGFAAADDGTVVGFSYRSGGPSYHATMWMPGQDQGVLIYDVLVSAGVDMSGWQKLYKAYGVSADGQTIAGQGVNAAGELVGFVAVIPEPATLSLLAFGGLALVRRRR